MLRISETTLLRNFAINPLVIKLETFRPHFLSVRVSQVNKTQSRQNCLTLCSSSRFLSQSHLPLVLTSQNASLIVS